MFLRGGAFPDTLAPIWESERAISVSVVEHLFLRNHTFCSVVHLSRQAGAQRGTCMASSELGK